MDSTERLVRGQAVVDVGSPIQVPVGPGTLGRIINVIGEPIDERGAVNTEQLVYFYSYYSRTIPYLLLCLNKSKCFVSL